MSFVFAGFGIAVGYANIAVILDFRLGYTWEPQIEIPVTKALAFYPVGVFLVSCNHLHEDFVDVAPL